MIDETKEVADAFFDGYKRGKKDLLQELIKKLEEYDREYMAKVRNENTDL